MRKFLVSLLLLLPALAFGETISNIERDGSWYYIYNSAGKKTKTLSASTIGEVKGWCGSFFVAESGSWIKTYDADGRHIKTVSKSIVGDIIAVSGDTFTSRKNGWVYTYDRNCKRLSTRSGR